MILDFNTQVKQNLGHENADVGPQVPNLALGCSLNCYLSELFQYLTQIWMISQVVIIMRIIPAEHPIYWWQY